MISTRRRSSLVPPSPVKPGIYLPHRLTFCPNVTPVTYNNPDDDGTLLADEEQSLFPPAEDKTSQTTSKRRQPPGKRRSQGYIPRPPNAFMLFRADFVKQKHVPGTIETNHNSLSKIIGNCWRSLPAKDKRIWEIRAKQAKETHKAEYPNYKFKPVHNKHKKRNQGPATVTKRGDVSIESDASTTPTSAAVPASALSPSGELDPATSARNEYLTQLLLHGHRGKSLADEMAKYDQHMQSLNPHPVDEDDSTVFGSENGSSWKQHEGPSSTIASSSSSPAPDNYYTQPQSQYNFHQNAQAGSYLHLRRSSSVPPMGMDYYEQQLSNFSFPPQQHDGNLGLRPPSPSPNPLANVPISQHLYAPQPTQRLPSFSQYTLNDPSLSDWNQRVSISQWNPRASISQTHRSLLGERRASSAQGLRRSWGTNASAWNSWGVEAGNEWGWQQPLQPLQPQELQQDHEPLPEVDTSLFNPGFAFGSGSGDSGSGNSSFSNPFAPATEQRLGEMSAPSPQQDMLSPLDQVVSTPGNNMHMSPSPNMRLSPLAPLEVDPLTPSPQAHPSPYATGIEQQYEMGSHAQPMDSMDLLDTQQSQQAYEHGTYEQAQMMNDGHHGYIDPSYTMSYTQGYSM